MSVSPIDPLADPRWNRLASDHSGGTIFHSSAWLTALQRTYGYEPIAITTSAPGQSLANGLVFCHIFSWLTGSRLVSLPFSDHCQPLLNEPDECLEFTNWLQAECERRGSKYLEIRPSLEVQVVGSGLRPSKSYYFHELNLQASLEQLFRAMHKDSIQRKIQRAEREGLSYESGSATLLDEFYRLLLITRKRQSLIPQPRSWFKNLVDCMGENLQIKVARKNNFAIAAMLTLRWRSTVVYKYGCSDARFHNLGGMPFLFWRLIEESKALGAEKIDLGRSDLQGTGLVTFKDRLGSTSRLLTYHRYPEKRKGRLGLIGASLGARRLFSILPNSALSAAGKLLYRHLG